MPFFVGLALASATSLWSPRDAVAQKTVDARLRPDSSRLAHIIVRQGLAETDAEFRVTRFRKVFPEPVVSFDEAGRKRQLLVLPSRRPTYVISHAMPQGHPGTARNAAALATIGAHRVLPGAALGFDVDGSGERIGLWDASGVRLSHREWSGRAEQRDMPFDRLNHASHVAGTLIASGRQIEARGAAPGARLVAHDWNNDLTEMAAWALEGGLVSNHSYGTAGGWVFNARGDGLWAWLGDSSISQEEDSRFGRYDGQAAAWDDVAHAAPAYLIVKSAGNERADRGPEVGTPYNMFTTTWERTVTPRPPDGGRDGFDTILDASLAKNVLTVGSVGDLGWDGVTAEDVRLSAFSSMGPTDDGRIKPDVVASGEYVESAFTFSDDAYGTSTGTSHAAPAVAGATLLLQELGRRVRGAPLNAASMKALLIHTALDVGHAEGPDYGFGWGLVRVDHAAAHVASGAILERVITEGEMLSYPVELARDEPLHVTLAWTDPAGTPGERVLDDRRPVLVNDLDLWVESPDGLTIRPWTLDPLRPAQPARRAQNSVDNVEQVHMKAPGSGTFVVHVSHSGGLTSGAQPFSLLMGRVPPESGTRPGTTYQLSGRVKTGAAGHAGLQVRLEGPVNVGTTPGRDGTYRFEGLPSGHYDVVLDFPAGDRASLTAQSVDIPRSGPLDIHVEPLLRLASFELLRTPHLLEPGESAAERIDYAEAGGVYGAELLLSASPDLVSTSVLVELDVDADSLAAPWIGERARQWVTDLSDWRAREIPHDPGGGPLGSTWRTRLPLIWVSGRAVPGDTVSFGLRLHDADSGALLGVDTLRVPVTKPDRQAPLGRFRARLPGLAFSPVGADAPVEATFWDGTELSVVEARMVRATDTTTEVARLRLADNGDLVAFKDLVPGDGVFTGEFAPPIEDDFRLVLVAEDAAGNRSRRMTRVVYSSQPYDVASSVALWSSSYFESNTAMLWNSFGMGGIQAATWDTFVRGRPEPGTFAGHDILVWVPSASDLARLENQAEIEDLSRRGVRLVIMLPETVPQAAQEWMQREMGIVVRTPGISGAFDGTTTITVADTTRVGFSDWQADILRPERVAALEPATDGTKVFLEASRPFALLSETALVTTLRAEHVGGAARRAGFLARLLLAASDRDVPIAIPASAPDTLVVRPTGSDSVSIQWPAQPAARFDVALEHGAADVLTRATTSDTTWTLAASLLDAASRFRIRSITPSDTSAWATFMLQPTATPIDAPSLPTRHLFAVKGMYPQPASQWATVILESPDPGWLDVRIHTLLGQVIGQAERKRLDAGENRIDIRVGHLAPGVYVVQLTSSRGHTVHVSLVRL